jgi:ABC-type multidrug transport system fused ATPase/permease subunit
VTDGAITIDGHDLRAVTLHGLLARANSGLVLQVAAVHVNSR